MNNSLFSDVPESSESAAKSSRKWLPYLLVAVGVIGLLMLPAIFGRNTGTTSQDDEEPDPAEVARREQQDLLQDVIDSIQPQLLGDTSDEAAIAQELNRWWIQYGPGANHDSEFGLAHRESLQGLLGEDASILALDEVFGRRDVAHLATALAFRLAGMTITTGLSSEVEKASASFYFVMRNMQIDRSGALYSTPELAAAAGGTDRETLTAVFPYQALLWGLGREEDRIWAFVELLRQIRIDSFLVVPADGESVHPLVAVDIEGDLLLYDPILGLPIPSLTETNESLLPMRPASFTEALANDAVFRQLDGPDTPYPWTSEALHNVQFLVVGTDSTFSPRMEALQQVLPSEFGFVVFDGWATSEFREEDPLRIRLERIVNELPDVETTLSVWNYPLVQAVSYDQVNGLDGTYLTEREGWLLAPTVRDVQVDEDGVEHVSNNTSERPLLMVRSMHIEGKFDEAMRGYLPMRNAYLQYSVSENDRAAQVAVFWSAICQFEYDRPDLAASGFRDYLREYGTGVFAPSAGYWLAVSLAEDGDLPAALEALKSPVLMTLPAGRIEYLTNRWLGFQSPPNSTQDEAASPQPVDETAAPADTENEDDATPDDPSANGDET